ncbi:MAG TPA: DinB family protein [Mycobacteriales bacterium]|nr:DinB family protein [Mycobacteriales bacterium]
MILLSGQVEERPVDAMTTEIDALVAALDGVRAGVLGKLAGLDAEQARRSTVPSGTNLAGLLQHLTFVEAKWFEQTVARRRASRGNRSMLVDESRTLAELRAEYREACAESNAIIRDLGDADAPVVSGGKRRNLRWAILAVLNETARHAGHADIIREQIDGRTGR